MVSVPTCVGIPPVTLWRRIRAAYDPSNPIHVTAMLVIATFGMGPLWTPLAPRKPTDVARNANPTTSGSAASPIQYAASGAATHAINPANVAGR